MPDSDTGFTAVASKAMLEEDDLAFLGLLVAEAETPLDGGEESRAARKVLLERLEKHKDSLNKADLYEFDRLTLELESNQEVIAHAPGLYRRYCRERGQTIDPHDLANNPPHPGDPNETERMKALRARMLEILRALHWSYTLGPIREKRRVQLIWDAIMVMVAATVIMGGLAAILHGMNQPFFAMLVGVLYAGVMGGAVSCARRLGNVSTTDDALGSITALKNSRYVLIFAPITGAIFAAVAMLLFIGELMSGPLFPSFAKLTTTGPAGGGWPFAHALLPSTSSGYALLFLWCFIAGFAERFIPDTVDSLTRRAVTPTPEAGKEAPAAPR